MTRGYFDGIRKDLAALGFWCLVKSQTHALSGRPKRAKLWFDLYSKLGSPLPVPAAPPLDTPDRAAGLRGPRIPMTPPSCPDGVSRLDG